MRGTGVNAQFGRPAAGKTGTSNDNADVWFAVYTPQLSCVLWAGNDDNSGIDIKNRVSGTGLHPAEASQVLEAVKSLTNW